MKLQGAFFIVEEACHNRFSLLKLIDMRYVLLYSYFILHLLPLITYQWLGLTDTKNLVNKLTFKTSPKIRQENHI
jgi:hypothetical protein